jgi:hypothetical protein
MLTGSARDRARVAREGLVARPLAAAGRGAARGRTTRSGGDAAACEENMRESFNRSFRCSDRWFPTARDEGNIEPSRGGTQRGMEGCGQRARFQVSEVSAGV